MLSKIRTIGFKTESIPYIPEVLTASDYKYNVDSEIKLELLFDQYQQNAASGTLNYLPKIAGKKAIAINFKMNLYHVDEGETPTFADIIKSCGWKLTDDTFISDYQYNNIPATIEIPFYNEGESPSQLVYRISGCMGNMKLIGKTGEPLQAEFSFLGALIDVISNPYSSIKSPSFTDSTSPSSLLEGTITLFGNSIKVNSFEFENEIDVNIFSNISRLSGYEGSRLANRLTKCKLGMYNDSDSALVLYNAFKNNTTGQLSISTSDMDVTAENVQIENFNDDFTEVNLFLPNHFTLLMNPSEPVQTEYRIKITILYNWLTAALTDFIIRIDLSGFPSNFWSNLSNAYGYDIRIKDYDGLDITAFDLININSTLQTGYLFVKVSLSNITDTILYIHFGNSDNAERSSDLDTYKNNTWSDNESVLFFDYDNGHTDHAKNVSTLGKGGAQEYLAHTLIKSETYSHKGCEWDGTYWYGVDVNYLRKWDASWNLVAANSDPCSDIGDGVNHLGSPFIYEGYLYIPADDGDTVLRLTKWNPSDLSFVSKVTLTIGGAFCAVGDEFWMIPYITSGTTNSLYKYDAVTMELNETISISAYDNIQLLRIEGIRYWRNRLWVTSATVGTGTATAQMVFPCDIIGSTAYIRPNAIYAPGVIGNGIVVEGITHNGTNLFITYTSGTGHGTLYKLDLVDSTIGGGIRFLSNAYNIIKYACSRFTQWSVGLTAMVSNLSTYHPIWSYGKIDSGDDSKRETLYYRSNINQFGIVNSSDGVVAVPVSVSINTKYRLNVIHNGTTSLSIFLNGTNKTTKSYPAQRPSADSNGFFLGTEDIDLAYTHYGNLGYFYLRNGILSDAWVAAETYNLEHTSDCYTIGSVEQINV